MAVGEYLVCAGVGHYCTVEAEEFVNTSACGGEFAVFGDEVGVGYDLFVAYPGDGFDWNGFLNVIYDWEEGGGFDWGSFGP